MRTGQHKAPTNGRFGTMDDSGAGGYRYFAEQIGSNSGTASLNNTTMRRVFLISWEDGYDFLKNMLGTIAQDPNSGIVTYVIYPDIYPSDSDCLWARTAEIEGMGKAYVGSDGIIAYNLAKITIEYGRPDYLVNDTWSEESTTFKTEVMLVSGWTLQWSDGTPVPHNSGIPNTVSDISLTRYFVTEEMYTQMKPALIAAGGCVNESDYRGYSAGTLLFNGFSPKRTINLFGQSTQSQSGFNTNYTITVGMKCKPQGHNYFLRPNASDSSMPPGWDKVFTAPGVPLFPDYDFSKLDSLTGGT
jgi:hypothetical protein